MKIDDLLLDEAVLSELGARLTQRRLELNLSQAGLATQAGVSKRTVERLESGFSIQLANLIRILRILKLMDRLEALVPDIEPRPLDLLKLKGKARKRVSRADPTGKELWQWGDDA